MNLSRAPTIYKRRSSLFRPDLLPSVRSDPRHRHALPCLPPLLPACRVSGLLCFRSVPICCYSAACPLPCCATIIQVRQVGSYVNNVLSLIIVSYNICYTKRRQNWPDLLPVWGWFDWKQCTGGGGKGPGVSRAGVSLQNIHKNKKSLY